VEHRPAARRAFGFWICLALVGYMIGAGVFALPAALAPFGWNAALGWLVTIAGSLCLAFVFARLARGFPQAGGPYAYTREAWRS
jgi:APA family basic amino acid/polyamine antiporter